MAPDKKGIRLAAPPPLPAGAMGTEVRHLLRHLPLWECGTLACGGRMPPLGMNTVGKHGGTVKTRVVLHCT